MKQKKFKRSARILVLEPDEQLGSGILDVLQEAAPGTLVEMTRSLEQAQQLVLGVKPKLFVLDVDAIPDLDRKSTRLNSSHVAISYAVFCLKKKISRVSPHPT